MKYPFFASFIVLVILFSIKLHQRREKDAKQYENFWAEEARANATRRKSLDGLDYISIPFDTLPTQLLIDNESVSEYLDTLHTLSERPIVNLTGYTNTELKLMYGAPNIDILIAYDQAYTVLARTLNDWGELLHKEGYDREALEVLEFAISTRTDVIATYVTLSQIYTDLNQPEKIEHLIAVASELKSLSKNAILKNLTKA